MKWVILVFVLRIVILVLTKTIITVNNTNHKLMLMHCTTIHQAKKIYKAKSKFQK